MSTTTRPITEAGLTKQAKQLGLMPELCGCSIDQLTEDAIDADDPVAYLESFIAPPNPH